VSSEDNKQKFARVVAPHLGEALALATWLTGNRADAEDVVQESSVRAYRAIHAFANGSARAWVLKIVRNTAYSWIDKNRSRTLVAFDDLNGEQQQSLEEAVAAPATAETDLIARADADRLSRAIADLPRDMREILILRDMQGMEYREIADVVGVPIGTVMSRLSRARQRVVSTLKTLD
jgi:RNA polymerase sigma-70 factor (ECF subfamily)